MRLVSAALFAGFIVSIAGLSISPDHDVAEPTNATAEDPTHPEIDPIVTGVKVTAEHRAEWEQRHQAYIRCPECVASQPFPGD